MRTEPYPIGTECVITKTLPDNERSLWTHVTCGAYAFFYRGGAGILIGDNTYPLPVVPQLEGLLCQQVSDAVHVAGKGWSFRAHPVAWMQPVQRYTPEPDDAEIIRRYTPEAA